MGAFQGWPRSPSPIQVTTIMAHLGATTERSRDMQSHCLSGGWGFSWAAVTSTWGNMRWLVAKPRVVRAGASDVLTAVQATR